MNILDQLAEHARERVASAKLKKSADAVRREALALAKGDFRFEKALRGRSWHLSANARRRRRPRA